MRERERLEDFRGGHVACRGCKRLLLFQPGELMQVTCCGYLYAPEVGPVDLVIYDRLEPGEDRQAQVMPPEQPRIIAPSEDEVAWYAGEPVPTEPDEGDEGEEPQEPQPDEDEEDEVAAMLATPQELQERSAERQQQIRRRGPRYD